MKGKTVEIQELTEVTSLALSIPTIILAALVVLTWFPAAKEALRTQTKSGNDWFILGVVAGFIGAAIDNTFWLVPWTATFLDLDWFEASVKIGVYFNVVFRQGLGVVAAHCHLKAAQMTNSKRAQNLNFIFIAANLFGGLYILTLLYFKGI